MSKKMNIETDLKNAAATSLRADELKGKFPKAYRLICAGDYQTALGQLNTHTPDPDVDNIKSVLLMRLGQPETACNLLRKSVLDAAQHYYVRSDVPVYMRLNFATALLMTGKVGGCIDILNELRDEANEQVQAIRADIRAWEKSLSMLRWLDWKVCGIAHVDDNKLPVVHRCGRFGWETDQRVSEPLAANTDAQELAQRLAV